MAKTNEERLSALEAFAAKTAVQSTALIGDEQILEQLIWEDPGELLTETGDDGNQALVLDNPKN